MNKSKDKNNFETNEKNVKKKSMQKNMHTTKAVLRRKCVVFSL